MSTTSMSLESLRFLLQHMDANRRFEVYNRCPSLREIEKSVPLKIKSLVLSASSVTINDTTYKLGIIRKYNAGETPGYVSESNESGGLPYQVDAYGIRDEWDDLTSPGGARMGTPRIPNEDFYVRFLGDQIQRFEVELVQEQANQNHATADRLELRIEVARAKIADYQSRRDNIPPNFEHFLQLTTSRVVDWHEQKMNIERYNHNKKYSEAVKQLTTILFGRRSLPPNVKKFELMSWIGVYRLPVGLKFYIEHLILNGHVRSNLDTVAPILHESSYPLKKLVVGHLTAYDANNPIVKTARSLKIRSSLTNILQTLSTITNPVVQVNAYLPDETLEGLIANLIESKRTIDFTIDFCLEPRFANEIEDMLKRFNSSPIDDENAIIPMSNEAQLKVSFGPFPEFAPQSRFAVRLLTEAIEH
ncbi:unnamed protein product [Caenorhabditis brenneri]